MLNLRDVTTSGDAVIVSSSATSTGGTLRGRIHNNYIGNIQSSTASGTQVHGSGRVRGHTLATLEILGNRVSHTRGRAIDVQVASTTA